jgi:hypothetical protein
LLKDNPSLIYYEYDELTLLIDGLGLTYYVLGGTHFAERQP